MKNLLIALEEFLAAGAFLFAAVGAFLAKRNREDIRPQKHKGKYKLHKRHPRRRELDKREAISLSDLMIDTLDEVNKIGRTVSEHDERLSRVEKEVGIE